MAKNLHRYYGAGYLHFITTSCYRRRALLDTPQSRDLLLEVMEPVRHRYRFMVVGYVIMPEHVHLLFSEPERGDPSVVMRVLKQSFAHRFLARLRTAATVRSFVGGGGNSLKTMSGNDASTILSCSARRSGSISYATCIVIR